MAAGSLGKILVAVDFDNTLTNMQTDGGRAGDDYRQPHYLKSLECLTIDKPEKYKLISKEALDFIRAVLNSNNDLGIVSFNDGPLGGEMYIRAALEASGLEADKLAKIKIISRRNNIDPEDGYKYPARNKTEHLQDLLTKFAKAATDYIARYFYDDNKHFVAEAARRGYIGTVVPEKDLPDFWKHEITKLPSMIPALCIPSDTATATSSTASRLSSSDSSASEGSTTAIVRTLTIPAGTSAQPMAAAGGAGVSVPSLC